MTSLVEVAIYDPIDTKALAAKKKKMKKNFFKKLRMKSWNKNRISSHSLPERKGDEQPFPRLDDVTRKYKVLKKKKPVRTSIPGTVPGDGNEALETGNDVKGNLRGTGTKNPDQLEETGHKIPENHPETGNRISQNISETGNKIPESISETGNTIQDDVPETETENPDNQPETGNEIPDNQLETGNEILDSQPETGNEIPDNNSETGNEIPDSHPETGTDDDFPDLVNPEEEIFEQLTLSQNQSTFFNTSGEEDFLLPGPVL